MNEDKAVVLSLVVLKKKIEPILYGMGEKTACCEKKKRLKRKK